MAVRFNSSGQQYSSTSGIPTTRLFTVSMWGYPPATAGGLVAIFWTLDSPSASSYLGAADGSFVVDWTGGGATYVWGTTVAANTWVKTALTVNGPDITLYQGSASSALTAYTTGTNYTLPSGTLTLGIGGSANFPADSWMNGRVAAFKMWDAVLTKAELEKECLSYVPHRTAGLNRWHPFVRTETTDYSGNGRTLSGGSGATIEAGPPIQWVGDRRTHIPWATSTTVWLAHYDTTTGELLSLGSVYPSPLPGGTAVLELLVQPNLSTHEWSTSARAFVPREGTDPVDRVEDLVADSSLASVWSTLDSTQDQALKDRLGQMLSSQRYRLGFQNPDLD